MSRFVDDYPFFGTPAKGAPATYRILLSQLRVSFKPESEQREAVSRWLETHRPTGRLAKELRERRLLAA